MCSINKKKKSSYTQAFILTRKMWDWHTRYMKEKPAYGPRDLSHLILSVMEQFVKADMQDELKGVDIAVIEDNLFKGWIQKNKIRYAFHGVSDSYIDYAKELSSDTKQYLWEKHGYNYNYIEYYVPLVFRGLEKGKEYNSYITDSLIVQLQMTIEQAMPDLDMDDVYIGKQLLDYYAIEKDRKTVLHYSKAFIEEGMVVHKGIYDTFSSTTDTKIMFIPIMIKYHFPSYRIDLEKFMRKILNEANFEEYKDVFGESISIYIRNYASEYGPGVTITCPDPQPVLYPLLPMSLLSFMEHLPD